MSTGTGQVDNPAISAAFHSRMHQDRVDAAQMASTADRILGLLQDEPILIELTPEVSMEFYQPSDDDYLEIVQFQAEGITLASTVSELKIDPAKEDEAIARIPEALHLVEGARQMLENLNNILARLSVDRSFTPDAFRRMPRRYKTQILTTLAQSRVEEVGKVKKFRRK